MTGYWLRLMLCFAFGVLTLMAVQQEGHLDCKKPISLIPRISGGEGGPKREMADPGLNT